jgi:hypothetical protein
MGPTMRLGGMGRYEYLRQGRVGARYESMHPMSPERMASRPGADASAHVRARLLAPEGWIMAICIIRIKYWRASRNAISRTRGRRSPSGSWGVRRARGGGLGLVPPGGWEFVYDGWWFRSWTRPWQLPFRERRLPSQRRPHAQRERV